MEILVCFKTEPQWDTLSHSELTAICQNSWQDQYTVRQWGAHDEAALECALRIRDSLADRGQAARLTGLTVGACPDKFITELYSLQFDEVVQIPVPYPTDFSQHDVAQAAAAFARTRGGFDLILTGQQVGPGESGTIPLLLAGMLGIPCLSHVYQIEPGQTAGMYVFFRDDTHARQWEVSGPCLCALENARHPFLRMAKLKERLRARQQKAVLFQAEQNFSHSFPPAACYTQEKKGVCRQWEKDAFIQELESTLKAL